MNLTISCSKTFNKHIPKRRSKLREGECVKLHRSYRNNSFLSKRFKGDLTNPDCDRYMYIVKEDSTQMTPSGQMSQNIQNGDADGS